VAIQAFIRLDLWDDRPSQINVIFSAPKWSCRSIRNSISDSVL
jgi:hypothetical protein